MGTNKIQSIINSHSKEFFECVKILFYDAVRDYIQFKLISGILNDGKANKQIHSLRALILNKDSAHYPSLDNSQ